MGANPDNPTDPMADIMSADDRIDALPAIGVKDLYVRSKLMRAAMDAYRDNPHGWDAAGFKAAKNALEHYSMDGLRAHYASERDASGWLRALSCEKRSEDWTIAVFNRITNDDMSEAKRVSIARSYLKDYLRGSMGLPDDRVIRKNLENYDE